MRAQRREFPIAVQMAIVHRASDAQGRIHCEKCDAWLKSRRQWEVHHILPEGMRPVGDKRKALKPADGMLMCIDCHKTQTRGDKANISEAKRRAARGLGLDKPGKVKIRWRDKPEKTPLEVARGLPEIARRFGG